MEIKKLIEKFKTGTITPAELDKLKSLIKEYQGSKELLTSFHDTFQKFINSDLETKYLYPRKDKVKNRLLESITETKKLTNKKRNWDKTVIGLSIAAMLTIVGFIFLHKTNDIETSNIEWAEIKTRQGEKKSLELYDGSKIIMNGNSTIHYAKTSLDSVRLVKLKGEAYFEISPNKVKPFFVITDQFITTVVGTSFNIDSEIDKLIDVSSGKVKVTALYNSVDESTWSKPLSIKANLQSFIRRNNENTIELTKGETAKLQKNKWTISSFDKNNWQDNILFCLNEPLHNIAQKVQQLYGDSIYVAPEIGMKKLSITFNKTPINQIAETLAELSNAKLKYDDKNKTWQIMK
ncbi:FecR family protein [Sphingobacterium sp. UT-1RO-CII-1]|uniref:FecR family protein n=1 Tax=Sphingobacterium sp. UT-1RO-CII-1 TaxID=2995225 RepID=UPI00227C1DC8|nr:FecR family protein [Sphingobacterium sp. UT-1RO-CII-1]MCY4778799.1 FecR family protein [Sphingobacterium sp. UT-1RO-CII-1]